MTTTKDGRKESLLSLLSESSRPLLLGDPELLTHLRIKSHSPYPQAPRRQPPRSLWTLRALPLANKLGL